MIRLDVIQLNPINRIYKSSFIIGLDVCYILKFKVYRPYKSHYDYRAFIAKRVVYVEDREELQVHQQDNNIKLGNWGYENELIK